jgi:ribosomal protein S27E
MAELRIVCDGCGSVYYVPEATACRLPCENCGLKLECHGGEYRDLEDTDDGRSV